MTDETQAQVDRLLDTPDLAGALENEHFKRFLDHIPIAIAVSELRPAERIVYVNLEFERLTGQTAGEIEGRAWSFLAGQAASPDDSRPLGEAVAAGQDYLGVFTLDGRGSTAEAEVWSNVILDDGGEPAFRLIAMADADRCGEGADTHRRLAEKDAMLRELQHRVRNNLQMITALVRLEARNVRDTAGERFERIAGRVEALGLLYNSMEARGDAETLDLGAYLSQIAASVMGAHAAEGIHLDLQVDATPVSVNIAMPTGLVVNELVTNALKHAFAGGDGGVIRLACAARDDGCVVVVADDGAGLPEGMVWPQPGKISAMIVHALRQNAGASVEVDSRPGAGLTVTISLPHATDAP